MCISERSPVLVFTPTLVSKDHMVIHVIVQFSPRHVQFYLEVQRVPLKGHHAKLLRALHVLHKTIPDCVTECSHAYSSLCFDCIWHGISCPPHSTPSSNTLQNIMYWETNPMPVSSFPCHNNNIAVLSTFLMVKTIWKYINGKNI